MTEVARGHVTQTSVTEQEIKKPMRRRCDGCVNPVLVMPTEMNHLLRDLSSPHHGNRFLRDWRLYGNSTAGDADLHGNRGA